MKALLLAILLILSPLLAHAEGLIPPKLEQIVKTTLTSHVNREMHDEFWKELRKYGNQQDMQKAADTIKMGLVPAQELQQAIWESALLSYQQKKFIKTPTLIALERSFPSKMKSLYPYDKGTILYEIAAKAFDEQYALATKNTERLLKASAAHLKQYSSVYGQRFALNEALIHRTVNNLSQSTQRAKLLFTEKWTQNS
jgi:hypothetical protein